MHLAMFDHFFDCAQQIEVRLRGAAPQLRLLLLCRCVMLRGACLV